MPFDVALSGLNGASADLEVISNNIANSNTVGFKESRAEFADVYAVNNAGLASDPIGQGTKLASVAQQFSQGSITFTENNLDLAISGKGFFRLNDDGATVFTRAGAFGVDEEGYLVNPIRQRLTGYTADATGNLTGQIDDLRINSADLQPRASTAIDLGLNVDAGATVPPAFDITDPGTYNDSTAVTVYDSLGVDHVATMYFRKAADNAWETFLSVDGVEVSNPGGDTITFNSDGSLNQVNGGAGTTTTSTTFNPGGGSAPMTLTLDLASITQYGAEFGVNALEQDGFPTRRLNDISIDDVGVVFARYSNGQSKVLGQIVLSSFANPQGLRQLGDTNWAETFGSGAALTGVPGSTNIGLIQSGAIEESNVDITQELVEMIKAQRNFQANAQVISTADTITQTIINIR